MEEQLIKNEILPLFHKDPQGKLKGESTCSILAEVTLASFRVHKDDTQTAGGKALLRHLETILPFKMCICYSSFNCPACAIMLPEIIRFFDIVIAVMFFCI